MEALAIVIQRFLYGLISGCILSLFFLLSFFVLDQTNLLPDLLGFMSNMFAHSGVLILLFVITTVLLGILFEGIFEAFDQYSMKLDKKENASAKHEKRSFPALVLWYIFRKAGMVEACRFYAEEKKNDEAKKYERYLIDVFMNDTKTDNPSEALWICEKYIESKCKGSGLTRYKELSFVLQLARFSFLCVSLLSLLIGIVAVGFWGLAANEAVVPMIIFQGFCFIASTLLFFFSTSMASNIGNRYIRDVGRWYKALKMGGIQQA